MQNEISVNGWNLVKVDGCDEPRIGAFQQGERLGYAETRAFKKLVKRHEKELLRYGSLPVRDTVSRTSMPNGGTREVVVKEPMLNEEQALLMCMFADTELAADIRQEIIRVYRIVTRGSDSDVAELRTQLAMQNARISNLLERVIELDSQQLRKCEAAGIRSRVKALSVVRNADQKLSKLVAFRRVDNELRGRVGYPVGNGRRWESFPRHRLGDVLLALDEMESEDMALIRSQARHAAKMNKQENLSLN